MNTQDIVVPKQSWKKGLPKLGLRHICSIHAPYMSHLFKDMGHIWDIYGTSMGHPILYHCFPIKETGQSYYSYKCCLMLEEVVEDLKV